MKIFDKLMKNKKDNLNITQHKKISQTTLNSRKNSNEKRINKLVNKKKNNCNKINYYNNNHLIPIKEKKFNSNNKSLIQQSENSSIGNSININNITSYQINNNINNSSNPFNNINQNDNKKIFNQKSFFPFTAPITKQNSKTNSKQKKGSREKIKKAKIEKINLINLKKNYTNANSPCHYINTTNNNTNNNNTKDNSIIHNYIFPKNQKLKDFILRKNFNSNINKLLKDFKNDI